MTRRLKILMTATEAHPFITAGGLGEAVGALARALTDRGHRVDLLLPYAPAAWARGGPELVEAAAFDIPVGARLVPARLMTPRADGPLRPVLLNIPQYFDRPGLYGPSANESWADNCSRFTALSRAALLAGHALKQKYDVIHAHDWPVGPVPYLARETRAAGGHVARATVFTVHNLAYQGRFWALDLAILGLGSEHFTAERLEFFGSVSFLKAGLVAADRVTTVSVSYAREVLSPEGGMGLEGILRARGTAFSGILGGIDPTRYDPASDAALTHRYSSAASPERRMAAQAFRALAQLPDNEMPLFAFVGALSNDRGGDTLLMAIDEMVAAGGLVAMLVPDHDALYGRAQAHALRYPERVALLAQGPGDALVRQLLSGSDFLMVPSRVEPCHVVQVAALRYGAVPLVRRTGGLRDTVLDLEAGGPAATGIGWVGDGVVPLMGAVRRAVELWKDRARYQTVQLAGAATPFTAAEGAERYEALYLDAVGHGAAPTTP
ncbi:MAG: glycogen synthase [Deltaproteobacteria bacterium]|nr:glycogen synthase [Deltaproteobacteria bacterium]